MIEYPGTRQVDRVNSWLSVVRAAIDGPWDVVVVPNGSVEHPLLAALALFTPATWRNARSQPHACLVEGVTWLILQTKSSLQGQHPGHRAQTFVADEYTFDVAGAHWAVVAPWPVPDENIEFSRDAATQLAANLQQQHAGSFARNSHRHDGASIDVLAPY